MSIMEKIVVYQGRNNVLPSIVGQSH
jgi:hypothetical protein